MRFFSFALALCIAPFCFAHSVSRGNAVNDLERLLYTSNETGVSIYDVNPVHKLLRKFDVPGTSKYKGIFASTSPGKLYLTSNSKDELVSINLGTEKIGWRHQYDGGYAESQAIAPGGRTLYVPMRDGDSWRVINTASGEVKAKIRTERDANYIDHPILGVGPYNTCMNPAGTRVYMSILTVPWVYIADIQIGNGKPVKAGHR